MTTVGEASAPPSITNTQEAGVDEGGIVKVRGDILVILRRGRLFTVSIADGGHARDRPDQRLPARRRAPHPAIGMTKCWSPATG